MKYEPNLLLIRIFDLRYSSPNEFHNALASASSPICFVVIVILGNEFLNFTLASSSVISRSYHSFKIEFIRSFCSFVYLGALGLSLSVDGLLGLLLELLFDYYLIII